MSYVHAYIINKCNDYPIVNFLNWVVPYSHYIRIYTLHIEV